MNAPLMSNSHQGGARPWAWELAPQEAHTLDAQSVTRWLQVDCGSVWLTQANGSEMADDIWLSAGQSLQIEPGTAWVLQAWPRARLNLLQPAPQTGQASQRGALSRGLVAWWRNAVKPGWTRALAS